jgi:hypothetical protein
MRQNYDNFYNDLLISITNKIHKLILHSLSQSAQPKIKIAYQILRLTTQKLPPREAPIFKIQRLA